MIKTFDSICYTSYLHNSRRLSDYPIFIGDVSGLGSLLLLTSFSPSFTSDPREYLSFCLLCLFTDSLCVCIPCTYMWCPLSRFELWEC